MTFYGQLCHRADSAASAPGALCHRADSAASDPGALVHKADAEIPAASGSNDWLEVTVALVGGETYARDWGEFGGVQTFPIYYLCDSSLPADSAPTAWGYDDDGVLRPVWPGSSVIRFGRLAEFVMREDTRLQVREILDGTSTVDVLFARFPNGTHYPTVYNFAVAVTLRGVTKTIGPFAWEPASDVRARCVTASIAGGVLTNLSLSIVPAGSPAES